MSKERKMSNEFYRKPIMNFAEVRFITLKYEVEIIKFNDI